MAKTSFDPSNLAGSFFNSGGDWPLSAAGGWTTAAVLLLVLFWQLVIVCRKHRAAAATAAATAAAPANSAEKAAPVSSTLGNTSRRISSIISDADLRDLITSLEGKSNEMENWEEVIAKKNGSVSYSAKYCRPKEGPLKYLSMTIFEKRPAELLRDFYMDSHYRKRWDKTLIEFGQLQADEASGTEIGHMVKKFPLLTPREYILAWRVWEGKDKTFYCITKDCDHPLALRQKKYVRVGFFRSGWRIRKVPGKNACEIVMLHQEDAGLNVEMAKLAFSKGIWSYICKMNIALHEYSNLMRNQSPSVATMNKLIRKVPPLLETDVGASGQDLSKISADGGFGRPIIRKVSKTVAPKNPSKWIANGLLLIGGIACLSRGRSTLGTQIALACIVKKLLKHGSTSGQAECVQHPTSSVGSMLRD